MGLLAQGGIGLVLLDLTMPHLSGEELLKQVAEQHPETTTIVVSGLNQLETAVRCMKLGAFDYFIKTDDEDRIVGGVLRAVRMKEMQLDYLEMSSRLASGELQHPDAFAAIVTADRAMLNVFAYAEAVAKSPQPLMITGESGVGKELIAQAVHRLSGCRGKLVTVNVAGLDDTVFADTLFGHVRGAFTGADQLRRGMVEEAADGTLFLDEIGDLSIPSQVKLLRLLQEGEFFPLGCDQPRRLKARIIVATHQNLMEKESAGTFRRDLFYRLRTHQIHVPPLRERPGDITLLLDHFLREAAQALVERNLLLPGSWPSFSLCTAFPAMCVSLKLWFTMRSASTATECSPWSHSSRRPDNLSPLQKSPHRPQDRIPLPVLSISPPSVMLLLFLLPRPCIAPTAIRPWRHVCLASPSLL